MRYFFSTGEASGEFNAVLLADAIRQIDPQASFEGIGSNRMREAGFRLWRDSAGWASMGPLAALPRIPPLLLAGLATAAQLQRERPDLVVLVDFGAFNLRVAKWLRRAGYTGPILYFFPPAAWLDNARRAREVSAVASPLAAFEHQRDFYQSLGLPVAYFGHPLVSYYRMRGGRPAPAAGAGTIALLPGSRGTELRHHVPRLLRSYLLLRGRRPGLRAIIGAADDRGEQAVRKSARQCGISDLEFARGTAGAVRDADAAWVASGTAVLECALLGVPMVAFYVVSRFVEAYAQRLRAGRFIALPNLVLQRAIVPELIQEQVTPQALADRMEEILLDPSRQYAELTRLRSALGPADSLQRCAAFAFTLAKNHLR